MHVVLIVLHIFVSFAIIGLVLLQAGKGAEIGSAFGGAGSQAVFGSMGTPTVLGKITAGVAIVFTITSFTLALFGGERGGTSVIREVAPANAPAGPAPAAVPAAPAAPAQPPAPTK